MVGFFSGLLPENSLFQPLIRPLFQVELPQDEVFQDQVFLLNLPSAYVLVRLHNRVIVKVLTEKIAFSVLLYQKFCLRLNLQCIRRENAVGLWQDPNLM